MAAAFDGDYKVRFNLAPPLLARADQRTGRPRKIEFGPWMAVGFRVLAGLRGLRGTPLDLFGYSAHRKLERALIAEYRQLVSGLLERLDADNYRDAVAIARLFERVRGYGPVKEQSLAQVRNELETLRRAFDSPPPAVAATVSVPVVVSA